MILSKLNGIKSEDRMSICDRRKIVVDSSSLILELRSGSGLRSDEKGVALVLSRDLDR